MDIVVLRYCTAQTKTALLAEIAQPSSMDHGLGTGFGGLCVAIEAGQSYDAAQHVSNPERYCRMELDVAKSASELICDLVSQNGPFRHRRTMWRMTVDSDDIIGLAERIVGFSWPRIMTADGVLLRAGAKVSKLEKVKI